MCALCMAVEGEALAQSILHFPRVISSEGVFTGLAISNPTPSLVTVTFTALNPDGSLLSESGVENPVSISIPAGGQYSRVYPEIFGTETPFNGWIEAASATSGLTGFFLNGNSALSDLDGAAVGAPLSEFLFPLVSEDGIGVTEISVVNPSPELASATATLFSGDGSILGSAPLVVPARGLLRQTLTDVFESIDLSQASHVRVMADRPLAGLELVADFQLPEAPTLRRESVMLSGQPVESSSTSILSQFITGAGWISHVGVVNAGGIGQEVTLTAYQTGGAVWSGETNPARIPLQPNESFRLSAEELFGFPSGELRLGWIEVESDLGQVATFIGLGNLTASSFALVSGTDVVTASKDLVFAAYADRDPFFTGLTLNNAGTEDATVDLFVIRDDGTTVGRETIAIPSRQTESGLFSDFVPAGAAESRVWAYLTSTEPLIASALMGSTNGLSLANVNPQIPAGAFIPAAQVTAAITGRVRQAGIGVAGVTVSLEGPVNTNETTDSVGEFVFSQLPAGIYTLTPSAPGAQFVPDTQTIELALANVDGVRFESGGVIEAEVPALLFVTPSATFAGSSSLNLRLGGANFSPTSVVQLDGTPLQTTFVSAVEVQAVVPAAALKETATLGISVVTAPPGGGASPSLNFQVNPALDDPLIVGRVAVGGFPAGVAIDSESRLALVASESADSVFFIDLDVLRVVGQVRVGRSPTELDLDPELGLAIVANVGSSDVSIIDIKSRAVVATIDVGRFPTGVAIVPGEAQALVVNGDDDNVAVIDLNTFTVTGTIPVANRPGGVAVNGVTGHAVVTERAGRQVSVIDLARNIVVGQVPTGEFPRAVSINPTTNVAVVANANGGTVTVIDLETLTAIATLEVGAGPTAVAVDPISNNAVVSNSGFVRGQGSLGAITTVTVINLGQLQVLAEVPVGSTAFGVDVDPGNQLAVVANFGSNDATLVRLPNPEPQITDIEPKTFPLGVSSVTLTIRGTGFLPTSVVNLNGQTLPTTFISATELTAVVSGSVLDSLLAVQPLTQAITEGDGNAFVSRQLAPIKFDIGVTNPGPGGGPSTPDPEVTNIEVESPDPVLISMSPDESIADTDAVLTLRGNNFNATSRVFFGDGLALAPGAVSQQALTVRVPASAVTPGQKNVFVENSGSEPSGALTFTVVEKRNGPPRVDSVSPSEVIAGGDAAPVGITITGSGFLTDLTTVRLDGATVVDVTPDSIQLTLDSSVLDRPGRLNGLVSNPAPGGGSAAFSIQVTGVSPVVTSFDPTTAEINRNSVEISVFGENFERRTTITVDGSRIPTTFISAGELQGRINQGILRRAGSFEIGVFSPPPGGGAAVAEGSFRIEARKPIVESVDPATLVPAKGRVTVTVLGRNFAGNSEIIVNGNTVKTLFNSTTELVGILDREILSSSGRVPFQVNNPEGGGLSDETVFLTIEGAVPLIRNLNPSSVEAGESDVFITIRGEGFTSESIVVMSATFDGRVESRVFGPELVDERTLVVLLSETPPEGLDIGVHVANGDLLSNVNILSVTGRKGGPNCDDDRIPSGQDGDRTLPCQDDGRKRPGQDDDRGGGNSGQGGGNDDRTPPGQSGDDDRTPPGQSGDDDRTPPGQSGNDDRTPPGQSGNDDRTPPGQSGDEDRTPPGQSGDDDRRPPDRNEEEDKLPPQFRRGGDDKDADLPADNDNDKTPPGQSGDDDDRTPPGQGGDDDRTPPGQDGGGNGNSGGGSGNSGGGSGNSGRGNPNN